MGAGLLPRRTTHQRSWAGYAFLLIIANLLSTSISPRTWDDTSLAAEL
jgi:hypothetical protein